MSKMLLFFRVGECVSVSVLGSKEFDGLFDFFHEAQNGINSVLRARYRCGFFFSLPHGRKS